MSEIDTVIYVLTVAYAFVVGGVLGWLWARMRSDDQWGDFIKTQFLNHREQK